MVRGAPSSSLDSQSSQAVCCDLDVAAAFGAGLGYVTSTGLAERSSMGDAAAPAVVGVGMAMGLLEGASAAHTAAGEQNSTFVAGSAGFAKAGHTSGARELREKQRTQESSIVECGR